MPETWRYVGRHFKAESGKIALRRIKGRYGKRGVSVSVNQKHRWLGLGLLSEGLRVSKHAGIADNPCDSGVTARADVKGHHCALAKSD